MEQKDNRPFLIYDWQVSPAEGVLSRDDQTVRLEPKAMEVLVYLAARPGEVITREDLERDVWHGALVGYDAVTNTIIKLRKALQDDARQPRYIATIPKKGYQLIADVSWLDEVIPHTQERHATPASIAPESTADRLTRLKFPGGVLLLAFLIVAGLLMLVWFGTGGNKQVSEYPSIVVLPFVNLSDDPRQAYLADGITEDITTDLSRMSSLRVLAGNTALKYKGKQVTPEQVGNELKVKFVLKGSIRQSGGELRVNAQLVNTATGFNVWAQRYDRKLAELFAVQDEVTQSIVNALAVKLSNQEKQRLERRPTDSLMAYDYFQEGQRLYKTNTIESSRLASDMYRKAIELDPAYGRAYGAYAVNLAMVYRRGWSDSPNATLDRALELANKAVMLDDSIPQTFWALGFVHLARKEFNKAEQAAIKSIEIAPNYADGYGLLALINSYTGRPEQAIKLTDKAISLNPYYSYEYLINYGIAYYIQGNFSEAIKVLERGHERNSNHMVINLILSASYVRAKRQDDAEWLVTEMRILSPNLNLATVANNIPFNDKQTVQHLVEDLRTAGLPE